LLAATFPVFQWCHDRQLADYSCGGSRGFEAHPSTAFPFNSLAGNRLKIDKWRSPRASIEFTFMTNSSSSHLTLVLGGARSGKSRFAEKLAAARPAPWLYIATAEARDEEMRARISEHRQRRGADWETLEAPFDLAEAVAQRGGPHGVILIDCLTLWLTNIMLAERDVAGEKAKLLAAFAQADKPVIAVSNEVGLGIVPDNALARRFRDEQGRLYAEIAALASHVVLMAAGLPLTLKGS
jgi:adenosylcobinamide kinase/adenosylcobinamide-phosphate guanylyltransferase